MFSKFDTKCASEKGSALVYILVAIALLAALTASFMRPSNQQTTAQGGFNTLTELNAQVELIRSAIQECVLIFPDGDSNLTGAPWPLNPSSAYLASPAANDNVEFLRCPGDPGNSNDHANIFGGNSGKFLPPPLDLFESWEYYNGVDGVFFFIRSDRTDAFIQTALARLDDNFSECQADVIDTSAGDIELTSTAGASDPECLDGETCFRFWITIQPSAVYLGDTDGEEGASPGAECP